MKPNISDINLIRKTALEEPLSEERSESAAEISDPITCRVLPAGAKDQGANPGAIYRALREREDPAYRRKECDFLYRTARPIQDGLQQEIDGFLTDLQHRAQFMDKDPKVRRARMVAIQQAADVPRALAMARSKLDIAYRNRQIRSLRGALLGLRRTARDWPIIRRRIEYASAVPLGLWCARVIGLRDLLLFINKQP